MASRDAGLAGNPRRSFASRWRGAFDSNEERDRDA
jgi:hypothetical protein